jgi:hypothetical protein
LGQFCVVAKSGNFPLEDLANFGYKLNMKIEFFKFPFFFFLGLPT